MKIIEYRLRIEYLGIPGISNVSIQQKNYFVFLRFFSYTKWIDIYKKDLNGINPYLYCRKELTDYYNDKIHREGGTFLLENISTNV